MKGRRAPDVTAADRWRCTFKSLPETLALSNPFIDDGERPKVRSYSLTWKCGLNRKRKPLCLRSRAYIGVEFAGVELRPTLRNLKR